MSRRAYSAESRLRRLDQQPPIETILDLRAAAVAAWQSFDDERTQALLIEAEGKLDLLLGRPLDRSLILSHKGTPYVDLGDEMILGYGYRESGGRATTSDKREWRLYRRRPVDDEDNLSFSDSMGAVGDLSDIGWALEIQPKAPEIGMRLSDASISKLATAIAAGIAERLNP